MRADFRTQIDLGYVFVANLNACFAGYVVFYPEGDHLHLENVAVLPTHTGKGVGSALVRFVEFCASSQGYSAVELYTNEAMTENLRMYPRLGYAEIRRAEQDGFERVFFRKDDL